jgi:hypothetical protein
MEPEFTDEAGYRRLGRDLFILCKTLGRAKHGRFVGILHLSHRIFHPGAYAQANPVLARHVCCLGDSRINHYRDGYRFSSRLLYLPCWRPGHSGRFTRHFSNRVVIMADIAKELSLRFCEASKQCNESLRVVMSHQTLGEVKVYGKLVGDFMGHCFTNILQPLWHVRPDLTPPEMHEPYVDAKPELTPESRAALEAFLVAARSSIEFARQHIPEDEQKSFFAYGGMAEVVEAMEAIEEFLVNPRFRDT